MFGTTACLFFLFEQNITTSYKIIFKNTTRIIYDVINVNKYDVISYIYTAYAYESMHIRSTDSYEYIISYE